MSDSIRPHPNNVPGPFYVEYGCCTSCDLPMQEAPGMFAYDGDNHCYVCRQPKTAAEFTSLIGTAWMAEFQCVRYRGNDPDIQRRLAELDLCEICDNQPLGDITPVLRNHVTFTVVASPTIASPQQMAHEFREYLASLNEARQVIVKPAQWTESAASIEFSWFEDYFHTVVFHAVANHRADCHIECPPTVRAVSSFVLDWLNSDSSRFANIKWYADADWHGTKAWQCTPW